MDVNTINRLLRKFRNTGTVVRCQGSDRPRSACQGRSDGGVYRYIYPPKISPWKLFCALIAADVVRLLVYRTVLSCSKKLYPPKMNFWLRPWCLHAWMKTLTRWTIWFWVKRTSPELNTVREISRETAIPKSSVVRIVRKDLQLKCSKRRRAQQLTEANCTAGKLLLKKFFSLPRT